jgi:hypothetical protein
MYRMLKSLLLFRAKVYVLVILLISVLYNLPRCWEVSITIIE